MEKTRVFPRLGVLGGMGPLATADFLFQLVSETVATCDQEHIPLLIWADPSIPDRSEAILHQGSSPLPYLKKGITFLQKSGASAIVIPCNTAHHWYDDLQAMSSVPILHIAGSVIDVLKSRVPEGSSVSILASSGCLRSGFYQERLSRAGYIPHMTDESVQMDVDELIYLIKSGRLFQVERLQRKLTSKLPEGAKHNTLLGCTELSAAFRRELPTSGLIDSSNALALSCVRWWREQVG
ncbi:MAG: aspartate/glutamate racemase family protein [Chlorobiaceae bacterium]|nr:aspartate/glutamate racemase family protein [Chlorobiaceae bacterium]NTW11410.1 aspartate/glutamate racemase family protein [Chlorobiaceae bacterium]